MIAHLDIDAFFAAVEMHRRPELRGRPVVVGGDPRGRGVVATASYAARRFGIRSAMSCAEALRRCPAAVFVPPDMARYREWSARVWDVVRAMAPAVEVVGLDEGYLELPPGDPAAAARAVRDAVACEVRLSCSLGVATCKVAAKIASDADKPGGVTVVPPGGIATIGDLAGLADGDLGRLLPGRVGEELRRRARGLDDRPVRSEPAERVSISTERTFDRDVSDPARLRALGGEMAARVAEALRRRGRFARTVTVKLRYADFRTVTRAETIRVPTDDAAAIARTAARLLCRALAERPGALRLLGVSVSGLVPERQLALF